MPVLSDPTGVEQLLLSTMCIVQKLTSTSGACCRCSFSCVVSSYFGDDIVHDSRHVAQNRSRKSHVFVSSHMVAEPVFVHGTDGYFALENRLTQTEEALVAERLARRTAEVAQQVVRTCPAGVDVEEFGRLGTFSGDGDPERSSQQHALVSGESHC